MKKLLLLSALSLAFVACGGIYQETYREAYDFSSGGYYYNRPDGGYNVFFRKGNKHGGYYSRRDGDYYGYYLNENNRRNDFGKNPGHGYRDPAGVYMNGGNGNLKNNPNVLQPQQTQQGNQGQNRGNQVKHDEVLRTSANGGTSSRSRRTTTRDKVDESIQEMTK